VGDESAFAVSDVDLPELLGPALVQGDGDHPHPPGGALGAMIHAMLPRVDFQRLLLEVTAMTGMDGGVQPRRRFMPRVGRSPRVPMRADRRRGVQRRTGPQVAPILMAGDTQALTLATGPLANLLVPLWREVQPPRAEGQEGSSTRAWSSISARELGWSSRTSTITTRSDPLDWRLETS
jgi:hypothetical protein